MVRSDGDAAILGILRNYFAPEAAYAIHQQVTRFVRCTRADQSIDASMVEYDLLWRKAESNMEMGAGFPDQFVSILRVNNDALSYRQKSLAIASCHKSLKFEDASANLRGLFGPRGNGSRPDDLPVE